MEIHMKPSHGPLNIQLADELPNVFVQLNTYRSQRVLELPDARFTSRESSSQYEQPPKERYDDATTHHFVGSVKD